MNLDVNIIDRDYKKKSFSKRKYSKRKYSKRKYSKRKYSKKKYSKKKYSKKKYSKRRKYFRKKTKSKRKKKNQIGGAMEDIIITFENRVAELPDLPNHEHIMTDIKHGNEILRKFYEELTSKDVLSIKAPEITSGIDMCDKLIEGISTDFERLYKEAQKFISEHDNLVKEVDEQYELCSEIVDNHLPMTARAPELPNGVEPLGFISSGNEDYLKHEEDHERFYTKSTSGWSEAVIFFEEKVKRMEENATLHAHKEGQEDWQKWFDKAESDLKRVKAQLDGGKKILIRKKSTDTTDPGVEGEGIQYEEKPEDQFSKKSEDILTGLLNAITPRGTEIVQAMIKNAIDFKKAYDSLKYQAEGYNKEFNAGSIVYWSEDDEMIPHGIPGKIIKKGGEADFLVRFGYGDSSVLYDFNTSELTTISPVENPEKVLDHLCGIFLEDISFACNDAYQLFIEGHGGLSALISMVEDAEWKKILYIINTLKLSDISHTNLSKLIYLMTGGGGGEVRGDDLDSVINEAKAYRDQGFNMLTLGNILFSLNHATQSICEMSPEIFLELQTHHNNFKEYFENILYENRTHRSKKLNTKMEALDKIVENIESSRDICYNNVEAELRPFCEEQKGITEALKKNFQNLKNEFDEKTSAEEAAAAEAAADKRAAEEAAAAEAAADKQRAEEAAAAAKAAAAADKQRAEEAAAAAAAKAAADKRAAEAKSGGQGNTDYDREKDLAAMAEESRKTIKKLRQDKQNQQKAPPPRRPNSYDEWFDEYKSRGPNWGVLRPDVQDTINKLTSPQEPEPRERISVFPVSYSAGPVPPITYAEDPWGYKRRMEILEKKKRKEEEEERARIDREDRERLEEKRRLLANETANDLLLKQAKERGRRKWAHEQEISRIEGERLKARVQEEERARIERYMRDGVIE